MEGEKGSELKRGFTIYGGSSGDRNVGIPPLTFHIDIDLGKQIETECWKDCLDTECHAPGYEKLKYREYIRDKIGELIKELHDNGRVSVYFEDEESF